MPSRFKIMEFTGPSFLINYDGEAVPKNYICSRCNKRGRLWHREGDNSISSELFCVKCKTENLGDDAVPAIPMPDNTEYWDWISDKIPKKAHEWWLKLILLSN